MKLLATIPILAVAIYCVFLPPGFAKCVAIGLAAFICGAVWWKSEP